MATLPQHSDTLDKILGVYLACVCSESFTYKNKEYKPKPLCVSPLIFRGYKCPPKCGGCCKKFTLDYLPGGTEYPEGLGVRLVEMGGKIFEVRTDRQLENKDDFCKHLNKEDGRCKIHGMHPFSCDFELIRFLTPQQDPDRSANRLTQKLFGRGWSYKRVDGGKGALCSMTPSSKTNVPELVRKFEELLRWADHFGINTVIPDLIKWIESGPHDSNLWLNQKFAVDESLFSLPIFGATSE